MKKVLKTVKLRFIPVLPCKGLFLYLLVLAAAYVFTQLYRSPIFAILFAFIIVFGVADILLFILAVPFVQAEKNDLTDSLTRKTTGYLRIRFTNRGIIPISAAETVLTFPSNDGTGNISVGKKISVPSFVSSVAELEIPFMRRGEYDLGAGEIFLYDTLRLIRVKKRIDAKGKITILPRKHNIDDIFSKDDGAENLNTQLLELSATPDYGDIREYRPGDSMKRIHWKLSTKSEELLVRKYATESEHFASVYCSIREKDLERFSNAVRLEIEDRIIEYAYSAAMKASEKEFDGNLYLDGGVELPFGNRNDDIRMAYALSRYKPDTFDSCFDAVKAASHCVCVVPFTASECGAEILSVLKMFYAKSLTLCVVEISDLLPEEERTLYYEELSSFLDSLKEMPIKVRVLKGGGAYGG